MCVLETRVKLQGVVKMALNDIYQLVDRQTFLGVECLNVWYFQHTNALGDATDLWRAYRDELLPEIVTIQHVSVEHVGLSVNNLGNVADFNESDFAAPITGTRAGAPQPSFVSWSFKLVRQTKAMRNGRKAFVGVVEEDTANNGPNGAMQTILEVLALNLSQQITGPAGGTFEPVLYRRPGAISPGSPEQIVEIVAANFNHLSTQSTRKAF